MKGFDVLIPALAKLESVRNWHLVLAGPDPDRAWDGLRVHLHRFRMSNRVTYLGNLAGADLDRYYAGLDALLAPSRGENFGNVIVEAIAQGTPVVVSDAVGLADWVVDNRTGTRTPLESAAWRDAIEGIINLPPSPEFERARLRSCAERDFDYRQVGAKMLSMYQNVLDRRSGGFKPQAASSTE
jgi:glycosyltransferase involved in cell wall biosynthesis